MASRLRRKANKRVKTSKREFWEEYRKMKAEERAEKGVEKAREKYLKRLAKNERWEERSVLLVDTFFRKEAENIFNTAREMKMDPLDVAIKHDMKIRRIKKEVEKLVK